MNKKEYKNDKIKSEPMQKLFKKEENDIKLNVQNFLIYGEKSDFVNEDIFFKEKESIDINYMDNGKSSMDLNLTEKNLHEFLNEDLIKALDTDLMDPQEFCDKSDSSSSNPNISESSNYTSQVNSPEQNVKPQKYDKEDINLKLNKDTCLNINSNDVYSNLDVNVNKDEININSKHVENTKNIINLENIDDKIKLLNDPLLAPIIIPNKENNIKEKEKKKPEKEHKKDNKEAKKEKKNNSLKNKFDDDVEPIIMLSMTNLEEKTKLPLEIRVGDWICLYCNNLNFSFRFKCNRCGLLRKSSTHLLKKKYQNNKYQYMGNFNNNCNDPYSTNYNNNNNSDLNFRNSNNFNYI